MTRRGGIIKKGGRCGYGQNSFSRQYFEIFYLQYHIIFFPFPFPFPGMIHVPKIGEWIFSFPSSSRILGMFFFIPFPFPIFGDVFFIPFTFPNFGNVFFFIPFPFLNFGIFFLSLHVYEFLEWFSFIPFPVP